MATQELDLFGRMRPDTTGRAWFQPYTVTATNDLFGHDVAAFADPSAAQEHGFFGSVTIPPNYVTSAVVRIIWTTTATTGNVRYRIRYRTVAGNDVNSLDQATYEETVAGTDAAPGATDRRMEFDLNLTSANLAAGETFEFYFTRLDDSGVDTLAATVTVHDLLLRYSDV